MTSTKRHTDTVALRKLMVEKGYRTILSLSEKTGINRNTLGKVLDGKCQPSADIMTKLVETLDITSAEAGQIFFGSKLT